MKKPRAMERDWQVKSEKTVKGLHLTKQTLLGMRRNPEDFPLPYGNKFYMMADDGVEYQIVNFNAENFKRVVELGCDLPLTLLVLEDTYAAVHDARIPNRWYSTKWDAPVHLLPAPQKLELQREIESGDKEVRNTPYGVSVVYHGDKIPTRLPKEPKPDPVKHLDYRCTEKIGVTFVNTHGIKHLKI